MNSVHVFHCFSTMDEAAPALRLLKRRLKPVSRAELRVGEVRDRGELGIAGGDFIAGRSSFQMPCLKIYDSSNNHDNHGSGEYLQLVTDYFSIQDGFIFHFRNERVREIQLGRGKVLEIREALPASPRHEEGTAAYEKKHHKPGSQFFSKRDCEVVDWL